MTFKKKSLYKQIPIKPYSQEESMKKTLVVASVLFCVGRSIYTNAGILPDYPAKIEVKTTEQLPAEYLVVTDCRKREDGKIDVTLQNVFVKAPDLKAPDLVDKFVITGNGKCDNLRGGLAVFEKKEKRLEVIIPRNQ